MVDEVAELVEKLAAGQRLTFLCFWGHQPERDGGVGRGCLSQWWPAPFTVDGTEFATAEHYLMWRKAMLFDDADSAAAIRRATRPEQVKKLGRGVRGFEQEVWVAHRREIAVTGNTAKFGHNAELRRFLLDTGDRVLVEASPVDAIWGIGLAANDPRAEEPAQWQGQNLLGFVLTEVRAMLAAP